MTCPKPNTRVIWEERDPRGDSYNLVLKEGRVLKPNPSYPRLPAAGYVYVTESPYVEPSVKDVRTIHASRLVW